jgi:hypothetical protein
MSFSARWRFRNRHRVELSQSEVDGGGAGGAYSGNPNGALIMHVPGKLIHGFVLQAVLSFCALTCLITPARAAEPVISEFMPDNQRVLADEDGQFSDWIEIHNPNAAPMNLAGYFLTDNSFQLNKWMFPAVTLPADGFLIVFASGKNRVTDTNHLHTNFQLDAGGGFLALVRPDGNTVVSAYTNYPAVKEDVSFGTAQQIISTSLIASSAPPILVPATAADLPPNWSALAYVPGSTWSNGSAPPSVGFDTNVTAGTPVNVAPGGTAVQSTVSGGFAPNLAIDNNLGNFTHTLGTDTAPFWQLTLSNQMAIFSVVLFNRTSCCGSRLRDVAFEILSTNETGFVTNYASPLLNPENTGFVYPSGPASLSNNLVALTGGPVFGQFLRVRRVSDPDLSGTGGQGNADEAAVLSLGEVVVNATASAGLGAYARNDLQAAMLGRQSSAFIRIPFSSANTPDTLTLRARYDDGFIAYLNGTEVARRNAPASPVWNSIATADRNFAEATSQEAIDLSAFLPQLVNGSNVLAVHLMNFSAGNPDLLFEPELVATQVRTTPRVYLVDATPGAANTTDFYHDEVEDTQFSVNRGFFEAPFSLSITSATPGALIYVSFNGDEPGLGKGFLYTNTLTITNTTIVRARAFKEGWKPTDVDTATYLFLDDVTHQAPDWPQTRVPPPFFPASWGANTVDYGMDPNVVTDYTPAEWKEALSQIPTMSVVTEMPNLFDPATGIYANALQQGELWERPASLELIDPNDEDPNRFQENCGLRIRGGFSRNPQFVKHAFRVFFRREYGAGKLVYPLFEDEGAREFDKIDLRTSSNYAWARESSPQNGTNDTNVREVWSRWTLGAMGQPYRRSRYYHLYLNGQYWGIYETDERPEASYGATYFGGNREDFDTVKCGNRGTDPDFITEATDGNLVAFSNLWLMCRAHAANPTASNYFRILGCNPDGTRNPALPVMLEVDNLIDYMLGIFFTGDGDATLSSFLANNQPNNWWGMRDRTNPNVGFRFFNSDCEHTLGAPSSQVDRTGPFRNVAGSNIGNFLYANPQYMHEDLMWNPEYRQRFADRAQKHFFNDGALTLEQCTNRWWAKANQLTKAIRANSARWGDAVREPPYGESDWTNIIRWVANVWFPPRAGIVLQQLRVDQLFPSNSAPNFSQNGGPVPAGYNLTLDHSNSAGVIYFTIDGTDPRAVGGGVSPSAQAYSAGMVINAPTLVRSRVLINGAWSALMEATFFPPQDLSRLAITEIMYNPVGAALVDGDEFEFLELKNTGTNTLDLSGLRLTGITFTFPNNTMLAPGGFFVLARNAAQFSARYPGVAVNGIYTGRLANEGERIRLLHALGSELLSVEYGELAPWPLTADGFGFSLVPGATAGDVDLDDGTNWRASTMAGGSPGADDPPSALPRVVLNEVLSHSETGIDFIELFNPTTNAADVSGWFLTDVPGTPQKFRIPSNTVIAPLNYVMFTEAAFNAIPGAPGNFSLSARGDDVYLFSADANTNLTGYSHGFAFGAAPDGETFGRYVISTGEEQFPGQTSATPGQPNSGPRIGPIVINEILYHADAGAYEFVELKNISGGAVPLFDPAHETNTWRLSGIDFTFPPALSLPANGTLLVVATNPAAFRARYSVPVSVMVLGPYGGGLQDSGERLELQRPDLPDSNGLAYVTVDAVRYNDRLPWPPAADGSGPSLQRKTAAAYGNDPANWEAALATPGADFVGGEMPAIAAQPQSQSVVRGETAIFSVGVSGTPPFRYVWRFNGDNIPGATNATLTLTNAQVAHAGTYTVVVFNGAGSAVSANATLTVLLPVEFTLQPASQLVLPGTNVTLTAAAVGNGTLRYQWRFEGTNLIGATNASYSFTGASLDHHGIFSVVVMDDISTAISSNALIFVRIPPAIVDQSPPQAVVQGRTVVFSVIATGAPPLNFRWLRNGVTWLADADPVLVITNCQSNGVFRVVVTNLAGTVNGSSMSLTVLPDSDGDGLPNAWETNYFGNPTNANAAADVDGDGMINVDEFVAGTNPTNALSVLKITLSATNSGVLHFVAQPSISYGVQYRTNLSSDAWRVLSNISAQSQVRTMELRAPNPPLQSERFYRVATPSPP